MATGSLSGARHVNPYDQSWGRIRRLERDIFFFAYRSRVGRAHPICESFPEQCPGPGSYDAKRSVWVTPGLPLSQEVARIFELNPEEFHSKGEYPKLVQAGSLFCYWAVRELLGVSATSLARSFGLSRPAISISVKRGEKLARGKGFELKKV